MPFDKAEFRLIFPEFADENQFPDAMIDFQLEVGKVYVGDHSKVYTQLIVAHLLQIRSLTADGQHTMITKLANEGDVSISLVQPPNDDNFTYWLNVTPYGMQLLSLLECDSIGGFYISGLPERTSFRKFGGIF